MIDKLNQAIEMYQAGWQGFAKSRVQVAFFEDQRPTAAAWKMADAAELHQCFDELRDLCDQVHFGWVNERWLITMHLKSAPLAWDISVIKLMQRRPGSSDAVGLDHIDFYSPDNAKAADVLHAERGVRWNEERNGEHCKWISVWVDGREAKLRTDTVLSPCIAEMQEIEDALTY